MMPIYRDHIFPKIYDLLMGMGKLDLRRGQHLAQVSGNVLEVGIGTGRNLPYYPQDLYSLTGLDNNVGMLKKLAKWQRGEGVALRPVLGRAEKMPFDDDSFDTVVSTHSLCSMEDRSAALAEIRRVLRPGGRFVFLEHGLSPDPKVAQWQSRLNGIQKRFAVGCLLNVPVELEIRQAGFEFLELDQGYQRGESKTHGYLYEGVAN